MEKLVGLWHKIVAPGLLSNFQHAVERCQTLAGLLEDQQRLTTQARSERDKLQLEFDEAQKRAKYEIELLRRQDPMVHTLDRIRHHAAQQRIRDLEREIRFLRERLACNNN